MNIYMKSYKESRSLFDISQINWKIIDLFTTL